MHNIKKFLKYIQRLLNSSRVRLFLVMIVASTVALTVLQFTSRQFYSSNLLEKELAELQNKSAMIAGDFSSYATLKSADTGGVYDKLMTYSAMDYIRYRVVDERFVIVFDSYSSEYGRNIINAGVMDAFSSGKSSSQYYRKAGTIEACVPVYNSDGTMVGALVADSDMARVMTFESDVKDQVMLSVITIVVVLGIFMALVIMLMYRPYRKAIETIESVAGGLVTKRLPRKGPSELRGLAYNFNSIMDKSNSLDESRQEFVSNVSHELKTPITSIKVLADSLNMQPDAPVELYREFMQDITKEIDRESKIIEDLLSIVKMDKSAGGLNISSVNMNELIEIVLKRLTPLAEKKNIEILFESFRPVVAEVDEVKITQVISNLVENAIKYNVNDGWVHVSLNADYQYLYIRVEDSGIGIPQQSQDMVFDRFYRVDKARSRETGGTGLGLAIVQQIVVLHHGTIKLYSEEGTGTTFTVRIPLNYVG